MAQKVIAVPKSTIIKGPPYFSYPATAFTILSAPTSLGLSYFIFIPVLTPGPIIIGSLLKYFMLMADKVCINVGTTDEIITSSTSFGQRPWYLNICSNNKPYSSEVLSL